MSSSVALVLFGHERIALALQALFGGQFWRLRAGLLLLLLLAQGLERELVLLPQGVLVKHLLLVRFPQLLQFLLFLEEFALVEEPILV